MFGIVCDYQIACGKSAKAEGDESESSSDEGSDDDAGGCPDDLLRLTSLCFEDLPVEDADEFKKEKRLAKGSCDARVCHCSFFERCE